MFPVRGTPTNGYQAPVYVPPVVQPNDPPSSNAEINALKERMQSAENNIVNARTDLNWCINSANAVSGVIDSKLSAYDVIPKVVEEMQREGALVSNVRKNILGSGLFRRVRHHIETDVAMTDHDWMGFNDFTSNSGRQNFHITKPANSLTYNRVISTLPKPTVTTSASQEYLRPGCWTLITNSFNTQGVRIVIYSRPTDPGIENNYIRGKKADGNIFNANSDWEDILPLGKMAFLMYLNCTPPVNGVSAGTFWYYVL